MSRRLILAVLAVVLAQGSAPAESPADSVGTAQLRGSGRCPEGHPQTGDIGIEYLLCVGGSCSVNLRSDRGYAHDFSTEPTIRQIRPGSPASGKLRNGDILIAIDGVLITTREGGRRLANLKPDTPVMLRIRRDGLEMDLAIVPEIGCNMPRLAVLGRAGEPIPALARPGNTVLSPPAVRTSQLRPSALPPVDFGMALACGDCGWYDTPRGPIWRSSDFPAVHTVEPGGPADRAGFRPGDVLLKVDGLLLTMEGGRHLGSLAPGKPVTLQIRRGKQLLDLAITPGVPKRQPRRF